jgi:hypothetical protein
MNLPTTQAYSTVPNGGVCMTAGPVYTLKCDSTTGVHLDSGAIATGIDPNYPVYYFPDAKLSLG